MRVDFAILFSVVAVALIGVAALNFLQIFPIAEQNNIKQFSSFDELKTFLNSNVESYGFQTLGARAEGAATGAPTTAPSTAPKSADSGTGGSDDYSTTNIQVAGVDEADIVKNDGKYIYTLSGNKIVILDAFPADQAKIISTIELNGTPTEIFVNEDKLVVFGNDYSYYILPLRAGTGIAAAESMICPYPDCGFPYRPPKAYVYVYDIADRTNPVLKRNVTVDGNYFTSRMIGDYVYAVISSSIGDVNNVTLPKINENGVERTVPASEIFYFDTPDYAYQYTILLSINTQNDAAALGEKTILMGSTQNIFASLNNIYITYQKYYSYNEYVSRTLDEAIIPYMPAEVVTEINKIKSGDAPSYEKFDKIGKILNDHFQTLSDDQREQLQRTIEQKSQEIQVELMKESDSTIIHRIEISEGSIDYKTNGKVPGRVLNQFSMDENNGYFRIATTTTNFNRIGFGGGIVSTRTVGVGVSEAGAGVASGGETTVEKSQVKILQDVAAQEIPEIAPKEPDTYNNVYVLDLNLNVVGKLEKIAPDEQIYSARFLGDRAYLVTFRRVDPLFVIDMSNPSQPKVLGELKIPGFSDYLHPYDETHIIGIGKEVSEGEFPLMQGVKLGLFDVSDPENPKEIAKYEIGDRGTDSEALRDHRAFLFSQEKNLLVIPIMLFEKTGVEPFDYGKFTWQGAYVFDVTLENGFALKGMVTHAQTGTSEDYYYFFGPYSVKRSLYIDSVLYTVSDGLVKMNSLEDLNEVNLIKLPHAYEQPVPLIK